MDITHDLPSRYSLSVIKAKKHEMIYITLCSVYIYIEVENSVITGICKKRESNFVLEPNHENERTKSQDHINWCGEGTWVCI